MSQCKVSVRTVLVLMQVHVFVLLCCTESRFGSDISFRFSVDLVQAFMPIGCSDLARHWATARSTVLGFREISQLLDGLQ